MKTTAKRWTPLSIAALVLAFMTWWALGLAVLAYILWGGSIDDAVKHAVDRFRTPASGNSAFDDYKRETLARLEEEQKEFSNFMEQLRKSRDREEFESFMAASQESKKPLDEDTEDKSAFKVMTKPSEAAKA